MRPDSPGVVLVGLLWRSGSGACPNLLQRRPGPGSAAIRTAEYQRFFSGAPARSVPLQQIWTNRAAMDPGMGGTGRDDGPLDAPLTPRRALRTRTCSSNRHSRVQSARLDEEGAGRGRRGPRRRSRSGTSSVTRWERLNERRAPPLPLCYALFSSLRLCTLCCTGKRSVVEGERAWRRERGVVDGSARPREPRGR